MNFRSSALLAVAPTLLGFSPAAAQITSPQILHGDTLVQRITQFFSLDTAAVDGTTTWDVSGLISQGEVTNVVSAAALGTWGKSFVDAEWDFSGNGVNTFWSFDTASVYYGGVESGIVVLYDNPQVVHPYPFDGPSWEDEFHAAFSVDGNEVVRNGSVVTSYGGAGTLNLPGGEIVEVQQLFVSEQIVDTLPSDMIYIADLLSTQLWDNVYCVPRFTSIEVSESVYNLSGTLLDSGTAEYGVYLSEYLMDVAETTRTDRAFDPALFPNPVRRGEAVKVVWHDPSRGPSALQLMDGVGRVVEAKPIWPGASAASFIVPADLTPGAYHMQFIGTSVSKPLIVN